MSLRAASSACLAVIVAVAGAAMGFADDAGRAALVRQERQPGADLGNGYYRNPILAGDYGDPSVVRVGGDFYMMQSGGGGGLPNLLIWHSRDLVNWRPIGKALNQPLGSPWAPDLIFHKGKFHIYVTLVDQARGEGRQFMNVVLTATNAAGPWSEPVDLKLYGHIDPGHVVDAEGNRWLFVEKGNVIRLAPDGLSTVGELKQVYGGWPIPPDWVVECFCLESPKLLWRGGWLYLVSAQGGTAGPSTSHMIVVARAKSPLGPWENAPRNPLLRTVSREQRWWSQGHGTIVDDMAGNWWVVFHAYENGYRALGRQTLLRPVKWNADGWPEIPGEGDSSGVFTKPAGDDLGHGLPVSNDFASTQLGLQWYRREAAKPDSFEVGGGVLKLRGHGTKIADAANLCCKPLNHAYEAQVQVMSSGSDSAGLLLQAGDNSYGLLIREGKVQVQWRGRAYPLAEVPEGKAWLKVRNVNHDTSAFYSLDGKVWTKCDRSAELSSARVRIALVALGEGEASFRDFHYTGLE